MLVPTVYAVFFTAQYCFTVSRRRIIVTDCVTFYIIRLLCLAVTKTCNWVYKQSTITAWSCKKYTQSKKYTQKIR